MKSSRPRIDKRTGKPFLRPTIHLPDGRTLRPYVSARAWGLPETPKGLAEAAEREIARAYAEHAAARGGALSTVNPNPNPFPAATLIAAPTTTTVKEVPTLAEFFPKWHANGRTKGNKHQTLYKMRQVDSAVPPHLASLRLDEIDAVTFADWRDEMHAKGLAASTINDRLLQLRSVLRLAMARKLIAALPEFEEVKADTQEVQYFTAEEITRFIDGAQKAGLPMIAMIAEVADRTGLRIGELRALTWDDVVLVDAHDVDKASGMIFIRHNIARGRVDSPKSRNARELPLSPETVVLLAAHKGTVTGPYVFPGKRAARISDTALRSGFNAACAAAGLSRPTNIKACNAWHLIRHEFATRMSEAIDITELSMILGHGCGAGDLRVTKRYVHRNRENLRRAMRHADKGRRRTVTPTPPPTSPQTEAPIEIAPRLAA